MISLSGAYYTYSFFTADGRGIVVVVPKRVRIGCRQKKEKQKEIKLFAFPHFGEFHENNCLTLSQNNKLRRLVVRYYKTDGRVTNAIKIAIVVR